MGGFALRCGSRGCSVDCGTGRQRCGAPCSRRPCPNSRLPACETSRDNMPAQIAPSRSMASACPRMCGELAQGPVRGTVRYHRLGVLIAMVASFITREKGPHGRAVNRLIGCVSFAGRVVGPSPGACVQSAESVCVHLSRRRGGMPYCVYTYSCSGARRAMCKSVCLVFV